MSHASLHKYLVGGKKTQCGRTKKSFLTRRGTFWGGGKVLGEGGSSLVCCSVLELLKWPWQENKHSEGPKSLQHTCLTMRERKCARLSVMWQNAGICLLAWEFNVFGMGAISV